MAAGDFTIAVGYPKPVANQWVVCGTVEACNTLTGSAILSEKSHILSGNIVSNDAVAYGELLLNQNATEAKEGSIAIDASGTATFDFTLYYV